MIANDRGIPRAQALRACAAAGASLADDDPGGDRHTACVACKEQGRRRGRPRGDRARRLLTEDGLGTDGLRVPTTGHRGDEGAIDGSTLAAAETRPPDTPHVVVVAADDAAGAAFSTGDEERLARRQPSVEVLRVAGSGHRIDDVRDHRDVIAGHRRRFLDPYAR